MSVGGASAAAQEEVAALYARSCPRLIGLLTAIGGSRGDAEEVAQEAYVRLLSRWERVRGYDDPESWVRTVAIRILISRQRRARVALRGLVRLGGGAQQQQPGLSPDSVAIRTALLGLPLAQRTVVVLHHVLDLPVEDIAAELEIPVGTVKSRLSRARATLSELLTESEETVKNV